MKVVVSGEGAELLGLAIEALVLDCGHNVEVLDGTRVVGRQAIAKSGEALAKAKARLDRMAQTTVIIQTEGGEV